MPSRSRLSPLCKGMQAIVVCIVGIAGLIKLSDLAGFLNDLGTWSLIPTAWVLSIGLALPAIEVFLAVLWFGKLWRTGAAVATLGLLCLLTGVFAWHLWHGFYPTCGCFGALDRAKENRDSASMIVVRNTLMITMLLLSLAIPIWGRCALVRRERSVVAGHPAGFTLIETLIVIVLVGLLVALLSPSLGTVRGLARERQSLANLRSHVQVFATYLVDWKDTYPFFTHPDPAVTWTIVRNPSRDAAIPMPFFGAHVSWNVALADGYYNGDHTASHFRSPESRSPLSLASYWYPCAFIASPEYWNPRTRTGPGQRVATRADQVLFPSSKAILIDEFGMFKVGNRAVPESIRSGFVDGRAAVARQRDWSREAYPGGDGPWWGAMHGTAQPPFMHTLDGVRGRDVK